MIQEGLIMTQIKLNKSSLSQERKKLSNYKQFLPSLDLKRQKLLVEKNKADSELKKIKAEIDVLEKEIAKKLPMIAVAEVDLNNLVRIESVDIQSENVVGVRLPRLSKLKFTTTSYSYFNTPHWLEGYISSLKQMLELRIRLNIAEMRVKSLDKSLQIVTQRKNLFEKVLIPKTTDIIRYIQIFLADN